MKTYHLSDLRALRERTIHIDGGDAIDAVLEFFNDWPADAHGNLVKPGQVLYHPFVGPRGGAGVNRWETPKLEIGEYWIGKDEQEVFEKTGVEFGQCYPDEFAAEVQAQYQANIVKKRLARGAKK